MGLFTRVVSFAVCFGAVLCEMKSKIVQTKQGLVEGKLAATGYYYEFLGVRYAQPVKFRAPKEPPSYSGIYKADHPLVLCPQFISYDILAAHSEYEDCLVLNIYTPHKTTKNDNTTYPVMVFLHGGDFGVGSGSPVFYGPQYLLTHKVVLVTVNYRLNVYGFLNLGIQEAPGNAGLKDIRAALRWIKHNIKNFSGDPDNVTVFGQGSGGVAAIYLTLSESTKGLFHRIISQSGSMFTPQSFDHNGLATASHVAKSLGHVSNDTKDLFKLYSNTSVLKMEEVLGKQMHSKSVFLPTVESRFEEEPFLVDTPYNIITSGKLHPSFNPVPAIFGLNTVEGLTCTLDYFTMTSQMERIKHVDFSALDQRSFIVPADKIEEFRTILRNTYFTNISSTESLIAGLINLKSDFSFVGPMTLFAELYANSSGLPVYQYIFNYIGNRNLGSHLTNSSLPATTNQDELFYIFNLERIPMPLSTDDARIVTFMTMMWTNFATYGKPTPYTDGGVWMGYPHHLAIGLKPKYVTSLTPDRASFWRSWYLKYGADIARA